MNLRSLSLHASAGTAPLAPRRRFACTARSRRTHGFEITAAAGRQHPWSGDATPYEDEDGLFSDEEPVAMPSNPVVPTGVSAAALPLCQQSLGAAFSVLDADRDGLINREDARRLVAFYIAQSVSSAENGPDVLAAPMPRPLTWDQHLVAGISATKALACGRPGVALAAMEAFIAAKMAGGLQKHPLRTSDLVWAALGMGAAMLSLGAIAAAVTAWPVGLPLLLASFGTVSVLLFGRPEAEAVRVWPLIAGQVGATAIALAFVQVFGAGLLQRAAAMALTVVWMMHADAVHPPGGALALLTMDSAVIQQFGVGSLLWPSLTLCLCVLLPISAITCWLRRNWQFDWHSTGRQTAPRPVTLGQKQQEWETAQANQRAVLLQRSLDAVERDRMVLSQTPLEERIRRTIAGLAGLSLRAKRQGLSGSTPKANTGGVVLNDALRRVLTREDQRRLEDESSRRVLWGAGGLPQLQRFERKLQKLHDQRRLQHQQQQQASSGPSAGDKQQAPDAASQDASGTDTKRQISPNDVLRAHNPISDVDTSLLGGQVDDAGWDWPSQDEDERRQSRS